MSDIGPVAVNQCSIEDCFKSTHARGLCPMHYQRQRIHGDLNYRQSTDPSAIEDRFWSKVARGDGCWEWRGHLSRGGYATFHVIDRDVKAHRFSYQLSVGPIPEGMHIDHMCHNRGCVNPAHLRLATHKQNAENRAGANRGSKSGVRGVSWSAQAGKWKAALTHNYTRYVLGYFTTIEEAAAVVKAKRDELYTHNIEKRQAV